jgi:hypothetical protein
MHSASDPSAFHDRLRKNTPGCKKRQGTTSPAAEELVQAVGRGFIPGIKPMESALALATEVCFSDFLPENKPFSAAYSVVPQCNKINAGLDRLRNNTPGCKKCQGTTSVVP